MDLLFTYDDEDDGDDDAYKEIKSGSQMCQIDVDEREILIKQRKP